jgi:hypothetical protein
VTSLNYSFHSSTTFTLSYGAIAMDVSDVSAEIWLDIAMDVQQDLSNRSERDSNVKSGMVDENPISLFGRFVSAVPSDILKDTQPQSEVS